MLSNLRATAYFEASSSAMFYLLGQSAPTDSNKIHEKE